MRSPARWLGTACTRDGDEPGDDLRALAEHLDGAVAQHQDLVDHRQRRRPMRDDDDRGAALLQLRDAFGERRVALGVEIGARLVEHDEARLAEHGAGQPDALAVAARQDRAALADLGVVAVRAVAGSSRARRPSAPPRRPRRRPRLGSG